MAKIYGERWEIVERLDSGGQAEVFRVRDLQNQLGYCALKRLRNPERVDRFRREFDIVRKFDHPGIVRILDGSVESGKAWYVMDLMNGGNLAARAAEFEGDVKHSLELVLEMSEAVRAAHTQRVIHRDLKPANILFRDKTSHSPVVCDFGIGFVEGGPRLTDTHEAVGPRDFIAPELEGGRSDRIGPHNDVYSLGKLLYYALTGGIALPRERHREPDFNLRRRLARGDFVSVANCQLEYVSRLLDYMIAENLEVRWSDLGGCINMIHVVLRLIGEGRHPITDHMPCRSCGLQEYKVKLPGQGLVPDNEVWLHCERCGHVDRFVGIGLFARKNSIDGPPRSWNL